MNITDLLQGPMGDIVIGQISNQLGIDNKDQTQTAVNGTVITLLNALTQNASKPEGANALLNALNRDHDGSILNDLAGFLGGKVQPQNPSTANGAGILNHILGNKQQTAVETISKQSGLDTAQVAKLMMTLAPLVLGMLGKAKAQAGNNHGGLLDFLKSSTQTVNKQNPNANIFTKMLDKDGDGSVMDDIAGMGLKALFNKLIGRK